MPTPGERFLAKEKDVRPGSGSDDHLFPFQRHEDGSFRAKVCDITKLTIGQYGDTVERVKKEIGTSRVGIYTDWKSEEEVIYGDYPE